MIILTVAVVWFICALVGAWLAGEKGRSNAGFWLGFFFGPIGIIIALLLPARTAHVGHPDQAAFADLKAVLSDKGKTGLKLSVTDGQTISSVVSESPSDIAGVLAGDRLVTINGQFATSNYRDNAILLVGEPGSVVNITVRRGDTAHEFAVTRR